MVPFAVRNAALLLLLAVVYLPTTKCHGLEERKDSSSNVNGIYSFHLTPTATRHAAFQTLLQNVTTTDDEGFENSSSIFHPNSRAVYAGLDELILNTDGSNDLSHHHRTLVAQHNRNSIAWNEQRQYSRFERARRLTKESNDDKSTNTQSHIGGLYESSFQSAPLSQGYGTHYATVWVGSPTPQRVSVIVDTGSHHTAFPCAGCNDCGEDYHTDPFFDPSLSNTFEYLKCGGCASEGSCMSQDDRCSLRQSYAEGSSWSALQARDSFFCSDNHPSSHTNHDSGLEEYDVDALDETFSIPFVFGCQMKITGLFIKQLADGIMGFSQDESTLVHQMYKQGKIEHKVFSMCFRRDLKQSKGGVTAGVLTIGGTDTRLQLSPMVYAKHVDRGTAWYTVNVKDLWVMPKGGDQGSIAKLYKKNLLHLSDSKSVLNKGSGMIVDSGTTDTYLPTTLKKGFSDIWRECTGGTYGNVPMTFTPDEIKSLPTLLVQMEPFDSSSDAAVDPNKVIGLAGTKLSPKSPHDILLAIPATHYLEYSEKNDKYTPRIYFTESSGGVIGANAMMGHNVLFDWENGRVGFSDSECDFEEFRESNADEAGTGAGIDCVLGSAVLMKSCIGTADASLCQGDANKVLQGIEKFSMIIEKTNSADGMSCLDRVYDVMDFDKKLGSTDVFCDGDGMCHTVAPCTVTCDEIADKVDELVNVIEDDAFPASKDTNISGVLTELCPNEQWSACQSSCLQSRINLEWSSDGCHESSIEERTCHIDDCGKADPCRVPFVVHAILVFSDLDPTQWTDISEDIFVAGFTNVVNSKIILEEEKMFGPGDVKILMHTSWTDDSDTSMKVNETDSGLKIVLEVSLFNENFVFPEAESQSFVERGKHVFENMVGRSPRSSCEESDLFRLSRVALDIHVELGQPTFIKHLLNSFASEVKLFPGDPLFQRDNLRQTEAKLLSSWTMKTEVSQGIFPDVDKDKKSPIIMFFVLLLFLLGVCIGSCCTRFWGRWNDCQRGIYKKVDDQHERSREEEWQGDIEFWKKENKDGNKNFESLRKTLKKQSNNEII